MSQTRGGRWKTKRDVGKEETECKLLRMYSSTEKWVRAELTALWKKEFATSGVMPFRSIRENKIQAVTIKVNRKEMKGFDCY